MGLSKNQMMWAGIILLGILAYVLFFKKRAKSVPVSVKLGDIKPKVIVTPGVKYPTITEQAEPDGPKKTEVDEEKDVWFKSKFSSAEEGYVGPQDCMEPCEKRFQFKRVKCFNQLNNGLTYNMPSSADECIKLAESQKINCISKCSNAYPTNQNFNYDVRDNFNAIIGRTLFEQGYI